MERLPVFNGRWERNRSKRRSCPCDDVPGLRLLGAMTWDFFVSFLLVLGPTTLLVAGHVWCSFISIARKVGQYLIRENINKLLYTLPSSLVRWEERNLRAWLEYGLYGQKWNLRVAGCIVFNSPVISWILSKVELNRIKSQIKPWFVGYFLFFIINKKLLNFLKKKL